MRQQAFLRGTAERLIAEQSPHLDPVTDAPLQAGLDAQQHALWSVSVPDPDAPIRGIGARELATIPPLHRDEPTLIEDLKPTPKGAPRNPKIRFTVSIGVAERMADRRADLDALIRIADQRLYAAKEGGRNRVVSGDPVAGSGETGLMGGVG